jgi:hypothetical protein
MDLCDLEPLMEAVNEIIRMENGKGSGAGSHRARVDEEMRRLFG